MMKNGVITATDGQKPHFHTFQSRMNISPASASIEPVTAMP